MKRILKWCTLLAFGWTSLAHGQGSFQNLGFESANVTNPPPNPFFLPFTNALPDWSGYAGGTNALNQVLYNSVSLGGAVISILDHQSAQYSAYVISGNYTATLDAGDYSIGGTNVILSAAIAQTSLTPVTARSLRFAALPLDGNIGDLQVSLNGQSLVFIQLATGPNFATYGADISAFAGTIGELRFTERPISSPFATVTLDSIQFSDQAIPEPGTVSIVMVIASFFLMRYVHRCR